MEGAVWIGDGGSRARCGGEQVDCEA
jgi:hypothetical protein